MRPAAPAAVLLLLVALVRPAHADPRIESHDAALARRGDGLAVSDRIVLRTGGGGELLFALDAGFALDAVELRGRAAAPERVSELEGRTVWKLDVPDDAGERATLLLRYSGTPSAEGGARTWPGLVLPPGCTWLADGGGPAACVVRVLVAAGDDVAGPGRVARRETADGGAEVELRPGIALRGFALAIGPWSATAAAGTLTPLRVLAPRDAAAQPARAAEVAAAATAALEDWLGRCPLGAVDVVLDGPRAAASGPGLAALSGTADDAALRRAVTRFWIGDAVAEEGTAGWAAPLAAYLADHVLVEGADPDAARRFRERCVAAAADDAAARGALVFHALRRELGDDAFREGLRTLLRRRAGAQAGWDDIRTSLRDASGRNLDAELAGWRTATAAPEVSLARVRLVTDRGRLRVVGTVVQSGAAPQRLHVPLVLDTLAGAEPFSVDASAAETEFSTLARSLPLRLQLDPDCHVPRARGTGDAAAATSRRLLPDLRSGADPERVAALLAALGADRTPGSPAERAARTALVDALRATGARVDVAPLTLETRSAAAGAVLSRAGTPVGGARALVLSPATREEGVACGAVARDPGDDLAGNALLIDVPAATTDVAAFLRTVAALARSGGCSALLVRPAGGDASALEALCADAPAVGPRPDLGAELPLPAVLVPRAWEPAGPVTVRVAWEVTRVATASVVARLRAPAGGGGGAVVLAAALDEPDAATGAATLAETLTLLASRAELLGRDVVVLAACGTTHGGAAFDAAVRASADAHAVVFVGRVGDRGTTTGSVAETANDAGARVVQRAAQQVALGVEPAAEDAPLPPVVQALAARGRAVVMLRDDGGLGVGAETDPRKLARTAEVLALAALALSVAP